MTDRRELESLRKRMQEYGAIVTFTIDETGWIDGAFIKGAKGIGERLLTPLSAAERMRQWLYERDHEELVEIVKEVINDHNEFSIVRGDTVDKLREKIGNRAENDRTKGERHV